MALQPGNKFSRIAHVWLWGLFVVAYGFSVYAGLHIADHFEGVAVVWPASGVALAGLLLADRRQRYALAAVIFITGTSVYLINSHTLFTSAGLTMADTLEAVLGAWLMIRLCGERITFSRPKQVAVLVSISAFVSVITTMIEAGLSPSSDETAFINDWLTWWIADGTGIIFLTPLIITWAARPAKLEIFSFLRMLEGGFIILILSSTIWAIFGPGFFEKNELILAFLILPVLLWSAFRFSPRGTATILFIVALLAIWFTAEGYGEFAAQGDSRISAVLYAESILGITAMTSLLLAATVEDRKTQTASLRVSEARFRSMFEGHEAVMLLIEPESGKILGANESAEAFYGYTKAQLTGMSIQDINMLPPEIVAQERLKAVGAKKNYFVFPHRLASGETRTVEVHSSPIVGGEKPVLFSIIHDITERKQAEAALLEKENQSQSLLRLSRNLERSQTYAEVLDAARAEVRTIVGYQNLWVYLLTEDKQHFIALSAIGEISDEVMKGEGISTLTIGDDQMLKEIAEAKEIVIVEDARTDPRTNKEIVARLGNRTIVNIPIILFDRHLGSVGTGTYGAEGVRVPTKPEQEFLSTLASHVAVALDRIHLLSERKDAVETLRESEQKFRSFVEQSSEGFTLVDEQGVVIEWNQAREKMTGLSREQVLGKYFWDVQNLMLPPEMVSPENYERRKRSILDALKTGKSHLFEQDIEGHIVRPDRERRLSHQTIFPIKTENGFRIGSISRDITEKHRADEQLRNLSQAVEQSPATIIITDTKGNIEYVNPRFTQTTGYTPGEVLGKNPRILKSGYTTQEEYKQMWDTILAGGEWHTEFKNRKKNGDYYWESARITPIHNEHGRITHFLAVKEDITARKQAEDALRESELKYRTLAENIPSVVYQCKNDSRYTFIYLNDAIEELTGYPKEAFLRDGLSFFDLVHPDDAAKMPIPCEDPSINTINRKPFHITYRIRHKSGEWRWVDEWGTGMLDAYENVDYLEGVMLDITKQKRHELEMESLLEVSKALGGTLELDPLLEDILEATLRAIPGGEKGSILLLNGEGNLQIRAIKGYADGRVLTSSFPPASGYSAQAYRERRPILIPDARASVDIRYDGEVKEMGTIQSAIAAPLMIQDGAIGVISIDNATRKNAFSEDNLRLLATIATSTALAIENARLFEETRQRLAELETLHFASSSLRTAQTSEEALPIMLDQTLSVLETGAGTIMLYDPVKRELRHAVSRGWFETLDEPPIKPGEGIAGTVFASGQSHLSIEFSQDPLVLPASRDKVIPGWGGACIPIRTMTEILGVLFVSVKTPRQISPEQMKMLVSLAEMTGAALHRMKLHEETSRRAEEFSALYQTSTTLSGEHDLQTLLQTIVEQATTLLNASGGGMYLYDPINNDLVIKVATEPSIPMGIRLQLGEGLAGRVAQTGKAIRIEDYSTWEYRSVKYDNVPIRATMEVPMLSGGELIGVLVAHEVGNSERKYSEADEHLLALFASQAASAIRSARLHEETIRRVNHLQTLRSIDRAITANMDSNVTLKILLNQAISQMNISAASILLLNPNTMNLEYALGQGFRTKGMETVSIRLGESYSGQAAIDRRTLGIPDLSTINENRFKEFVTKESFSSCYIAPMISKGQMRGVLEVYSREVLIADNEWIEFLEALATQAAIAIDNAQLFLDLQHTNFQLTLAYDAIIEGWSQALGHRDKAGQGRTKRLAELTIQFARAAGVQESEIIHIRRGALLHDIGKMYVPDQILTKPGKLTQKERERLEKHPQFAYDILKSNTFLRPALDIPYCHHERWDGAGYPRGLRGEQIPLAARIFAVVDVWDALTSDRPYCKAWPHKKALAYIRSQSGKHFDPKIVDLFLQFWEK